MKRSRVPLILLGVVMVVGSLALGIFLLYENKLNGGEFVAFVIALSIIGVMTGYGPEVQEISIAGNVVKLREIRAEAESAIESLKETRVEMLQLFMESAMKLPGGFGSQAMVDKRNRDFWFVLGLVRKYNALVALKDDILKHARLLATVQLKHLKDQHCVLGDVDPKDLPDQLDIAQLVLDPAGLMMLAQTRGRDLSFVKDNIREGLDEYMKFKALLKELECMGT